MPYECKKCKNYLETEEPPNKCPVCYQLNKYQKVNEKIYGVWICSNCGMITQRSPNLEDGKCFNCDEVFILHRLDRENLTREDILYSLRHIEWEFDDYQLIDEDSLKVEVIEHLGVKDIDWEIWNEGFKKVQEEGLLIKRVSYHFRV